MAGPNFDVIVGLRDPTSEVEVSRAISRAAVAKGFGLIFGISLIRCLYKSEGEMLEDLSREVTNPVVFSITSSPTATDAMELFERQLNPTRGANPKDAAVLRFMDDLFAIHQAKEIIFILWESMLPSAKFMPRHIMAESEFRNWIMDYYKIDSGDSAEGAEGIFLVKRRDSFEAGKR